MNGIKTIKYKAPLFQVWKKVGLFVLMGIKSKRIAYLFKGSLKKTAGNLPAA